MCLYPKLIKNRRYTANKKNRGVIPPIKDKRVLEVPVGCGKCMECKKMKAREWQVRLHEDLRQNKNGKFVTLSFSEEELQKIDNEIGELHGYERDNEICRIAVRRYTERWRKKYGKTIRHWLVTEIGGENTERIHLHGIVWADSREDIEKIWKYGNVWIGDYVNGQTINYIVKYINKTDQKHPNYISKIYTSKGIGKGYINRPDSERNKYNGTWTKGSYKTKTGMEIPLPIYYRNKLYTDEEKEKLWLNKLDKEVRYVNGIEIDISENEDEYYKVLEQEREKNKRLGYGDDALNWEKKKYENARRNLKKMERLQKLWKKDNTGQAP